jgi:hypothetical protein
MIPPVAHFIWYGEHFPWVHLLAIRSALARGGFDRAVLHHDADLSGNPFVRRLGSLDAVELRRMETSALFEVPGLDPGRLRSLHDALVSPPARANLVRAAILAREGGVYLDMDTVTVRSLSDLLRTGVFCGEERIVFPSEVVRSRRPDRLARALFLFGLRGVIHRLPDGWRAFRRVEHLYHRAVNNAVLGAAAGHDFVLGMLDDMLSMPPDRQRVRFALGTHLLQRCVARYGEADLKVLPPPFFYPLGPEISRHWFVACRRPAVDEVLSGETRVVHWYASVRNRDVIPGIDPDYVRAHRSDQLFSALVDPLLPDID